MRAKGYFEGKKPYLDVCFKGHKKKIGMLIDTGFSGCLALPQDIIKKMKLKRIGEGRYLTVRGRHLIIKVYIAFIHWFGKIEKTTAIVTKSSHPLIGMGLLYNNKLEISGSQGRVLITHKPSR